MTSPRCCSAGSSRELGIALGGYYRSRPLLLTLGLSIEEALASTMMRAGSMSEGRDIGVVFNLPRRDGPVRAARMRRGRHAVHARRRVGAGAALPARRCSATRAVAGSIAVAHGGDASTATNGFWSALNIATTERLPLLFFIEDNGYGISVPAEHANAGRQHRAQPERLSRPARARRRRLGSAWPRPS